MKIACKFARGFDIMETVGQGRLAERPNAAVLKTVDGQLSGGSNPSPSAIHQAAGHNSAPPLGVYMGGGEGFEGRQAKFVPFHAQILRRSASSNLPTRSALWAVDRARRPRRESLTLWSGPRDSLSPILTGVDFFRQVGYNNIKEYEKTDFRLHGCR